MLIIIDLYARLSPYIILRAVRVCTFSIPGFTTPTAPGAPVQFNRFITGPQSNRDEPFISLINNKILIIINQTLGRHIQWQRQSS